MSTIHWRLHLRSAPTTVYDALATPLADGTIHELRIKTKGTT